MPDLDPCNICESPVRIRKTELPRALGQTQGEVIDERVCTSPTCPSNTGNRSLGQTV